MKPEIPKEKPFMKSISFWTQMRDGSFLNVLRTQKCQKSELGWVEGGDGNIQKNKNTLYTLTNIDIESPFFLLDLYNIVPEWL